MSTKPTAGTTPTAAKTVHANENASIEAQRLNMSLAQPFKPLDTSGVGSSDVERYAARTAHAAEYAAGQLFLIRQHIEASNPTAALADIETALDRVRSEIVTGNNK
jgi:hypothetical protein